MGLLYGKRGRGVAVFEFQNIVLWSYRVSALSILVSVVFTWFGRRRQQGSGINPTPTYNLTHRIFNIIRLSNFFFFFFGGACKARCYLITVNCSPSLFNSLLVT